MSMYVQVNMYVHRRVGTYTVREARWFKINSPGIMILLIPMEFSVYTSEMKTNGPKFVILEYLRRYLYYVQVKLICT